MKYINLEVANGMFKIIKLTENEMKVELNKTYKYGTQVVEVIGIDTKYVWIRYDDASCSTLLIYDFERYATLIKPATWYNIWIDNRNKPYIGGIKYNSEAEAKGGTNIIPTYHSTIKVGGE